MHALTTSLKARFSILDVTALSKVGRKTRPNQALLTSLSRYLFRQFSNFSPSKF